jgi:RNA-binding protein PNO1
MATATYTSEGDGEFEEIRNSRKRKVKDMEDVTCSRPVFPKIDASSLLGTSPEYRSIPVPPHRFTPLKDQWMKIFTPLVDHLKLQVRLNLKKKQVEIKTSQYTTDPGAIQKGADFVKGFMLGFEIDDALALVRLDDLYIETFEVQDVKPLKGDHLSRAIGRIAGTGGKTRYTIENVTKTRIVLADRYNYDNNDLIQLTNITHTLVRYQKIIMST